MIHQYKLNGYNIVIDANSASVHTVDEVAYDIIEMIDSAVASGRPADVALNDEALHCEIIMNMKSRYGVSEDDVLETIEDLAQLHEEGLLWSDDIYEASADQLKIKQSVLKAICLHVAHGCNMDCEYCFAGKGRLITSLRIQAAEGTSRWTSSAVSH